MLKRLKDATQLHSAWYVCCKEINPQIRAWKTLQSPKPAKVGVGALFSKQYIKGTMFIWIAYFFGTFVVMGMNAWLPKMMVTAGYSYGLATLNNGAAVIANVLASIGAEKSDARRTSWAGLALRS